VIKRDDRFPHLIRGQGQAKSVIIAVGGGKGGVGKSFVSTNLSIFLANMGFSTLLLDLDLGAPNLHTYLGEEPPTKNFHEYLRGRSTNLIDTSVPTKFPKLRLISGANDHTELANISVSDQSRLMSGIFQLSTDFVVLDLSAGTHTSTLDFFLMAEHQILVMTPEPTSIENAYRFMKAAFFRKIKRFEMQLGLKETVRKLMSQQEEKKIRYPSDLIAEIVKLEPARGQQLKQLMGDLDFNIVLNQIRSSKELHLGTSVESVCRRYFGVPTRFLGHLEYDNAAWHSIRKRRPLLLDYPQSPLYTQVLSLARDLASPHLKKAVV
jgi:flagellar biosynthesis protein FlhG